MTAPDPLARIRAIDAELGTLYARVDALLRERAWLVAPRPGPGGAESRPGGGPAGGAAVAVGSGARPAREASPVTAQTVLLALGGLLLGTAAVVFTLVAWWRMDLE